MPTRDEIARAVEAQKGGGQDSIRRKYLKQLQKHTGRDTIAYFSSYNVQRPYNVPLSAYSVAQDDIQGFMTSLHNLKGKQLDLILHSPGGSSEAADQIVQYLRSKYDHIRAIIPQNAMSAATMIACACDEIVMGKHSAIGPIDPQISGVPAHAILKDFERARSDVAGNPNLGAIWAPWLASMPKGFLNFCEETIELSKRKVEEWLRLYMLKGKPPQLAHDIAEWLGRFDEHRTHGRPIGFDLALSKGLNVTRLEADQALQEAVLSVYHSMMVTFERTNCLKIIENQNGKGHYLVAHAVTVASGGIGAGMGGGQSSP